MSAPIMPEAGISLSRTLALRARIAVGVAFLVCAMSPQRIQRVLTWVVKGAGRPSPPDVARWRGAVNTVSRRCAGEGCLQRSIAVVLLCRSFGVAPTWKTGFRPSPFVAHAWVEVDGAAVGEPTAITDFRTVLVVSPHH
ncbi:lasso peptide biosynthesis B2 protein [Streptomyces ossamyceticus]|nr:lasso peptide biosynthesis B2 protein [Streptomyces ossamyceticus]